MEIEECVVPKLLLEEPKEIKPQPLVNSAKAKEAIKKLLKFSKTETKSKANDLNLLSSDDQTFSLEIRTHKIHFEESKPWYLRFPNPVYPKSDVRSIFIVIEGNEKDVTKYEEYLRSNRINSIKVSTKKFFNRDYHDDIQKKNVRNTYDEFVVEQEAVTKHAMSCFGYSWMKSNKVPKVLKFGNNKEKLVEFCNSDYSHYTLLRPFQTNTIRVHFGNSEQSEETLYKNLEYLVEYMKQRLLGGMDAIEMLSIKTNQSPTLPFYVNYNIPKSVKVNTEGKVTELNGPEYNDKIKEENKAYLKQKKAAATKKRLRDTEEWNEFETFYGEDDEENQEKEAVKPVTPSKAESKKSATPVKKVEEKKSAAPVKKVEEKKSNTPTKKVEEKKSATPAKKVEAKKPVATQDDSDEEIDSDFDINDLDSDEIEDIQLDDEIRDDEDPIGQVPEGEEEEEPVQPTKKSKKNNAKPATPTKKQQAKVPTPTKQPEAKAPTPKKMQVDEPKTNKAKPVTPSKKPEAKKPATEKPATPAKKPEAKSATEKPATPAKKPEAKTPTPKKMQVDEPKTNQAKPVTPSKKPEAKKPATEKPATPTKKPEAKKSATEKPIEKAVTKATPTKSVDNKKPVSKKSAEPKPAAEKPVEKPISKKLPVTDSKKIVKSK